MCIDFQFGVTRVADKLRQSSHLRFDRPEEISVLHYSERGLDIVVKHAVAVKVFDLCTDKIVGSLNAKSRRHHLLVDGVDAGKIKTLRRNHKLNRNNSLDIL